VDLRLGKGRDASIAQAGLDALEKLVRK